MNEYTNGNGPLNIAERGMQSQMSSFASTSDREPWKALHDEAMACARFDDYLKLGIDAIESIFEWDRLYSDAALDGLVEWSASHDNSVSQGMRTWLSRAQHADTIILVFERARCSMQHASRFRELIREVQWLLLPETEKFDSDQIAALRDDAVDMLRGA